MFSKVHVGWNTNSLKFLEHSETEGQTLHCLFSKATTGETSSSHLFGSHSSCSLLTTFLSRAFVGITETLLVDEPDRVPGLEAGVVEVEVGVGSPGTTVAKIGRIHHHLIPRTHRIMVQMEGGDLASGPVLLSEEQRLNSGTIGGKQNQERIGINGARCLYKVRLVLDRVCSGVVFLLDGQRDLMTMTVEKGHRTSAV